MSLFEIKKITVGPETLTAKVQLAADAPAKTSEDMEGTQRVYDLMPQIAEHACVSERGDVFRDALPDTETAHLLEHVVVELMSRLEAEDMSVGNTFAAEGEERTWNVKLSCPNDVLVVGAISSAVWILDWAFSGEEAGKPNVDSIVEGLRSLILSLPTPAKR